MSLLHLLASCYAPLPVTVAAIASSTSPITAAVAISVFNRSLREVIGNDPIVSSTLTSGTSTRSVNIMIHIDLTDHVTTAVSENQPAYVWGDTIEQLLRYVSNVFALIIFLHHIIQI